MTVTTFVPRPEQSVNNLSQNYLIEFVCASRVLHVHPLYIDGEHVYIAEIRGRWAAAQFGTVSKCLHYSFTFCSFVLILPLNYALLPLC
jgi:hypothetical protein